MRCEPCGKDPQRLTALVLLGLKDRESFPLVFYRENCADMALEVSDFEEAFIASSRALLITGTHFSTGQVDKASRLALEYARRNEVRTILDIDYRPVLWGLTGKAEGEVRYVSSEGVTRHLQRILPSSTWWWAPRRSLRLPEEAKFSLRRCARCAK